MEEKEPNKYVADLLKQLEELKKRKAHKERKLMKLNKDSSESRKLSRKFSPHSKTLTSDLISINKVHFSGNYSDKNCVFIPNSEINISKKSDGNLEMFENHTIKNKSNAQSDATACIEEHGTSFEGAKGSVLSEQRTHQNLKDDYNESVLEHDVDKRESLLPQTGLDENKIACNESKMNISSTEKNLSSNDKKTNFVMNGEPLDANMSDVKPFKSADVPDCKIFPFSLSFSNDSQCNLDFPKFSSPTDTQYCNNKNLPNNLNQIMTSPKLHCDQSEVHNSKSENMNTIVSSPVCENKINSILGNTLSSILDAHYASPMKAAVTKRSIDPNLNFSVDIQNGNESKKRKLFPISNNNFDLKKESMCDNSFCSKNIETKLCAPVCDLKQNLSRCLCNNNDQFIEDDIDFGNTTFDSLNDSFMDPKSNNKDDSSETVTKTIHCLIDEVCKYSQNNKSSTVKDNINICNGKHDTQVLMVPETEGFEKDFFETSGLNESMSCQLSPVVKSVEKSFQRENPIGSQIDEIAAENAMSLEYSFLKDDTPRLDYYKHFPDSNIQPNPDESKSNLSFSGFLHGSTNEPVIDVEIVLFNGSDYAFVQHENQLNVWRKEKNEWSRIFQHQIEGMLSLSKIGTSMDEENLILVMLLNKDHQYCLQFLLFEKHAQVIKLMENTHWLEERFSKESVLLCGLDGLMFATAQFHENHEVALHAFINLKDKPQLMTASLGSVDGRLCSLCKIDKLPNALMGVNDSMLYVWHILEARLVTAVSLYPHEYLRVQNCIWATVEKGLIYFLTSCEGEKDFAVCQLLAANLATGFCQCAMTYSTQPSKCKTKMKIRKAAYKEPFLAVAYSGGALLWSITEEYCCAALSSKSQITTVAISKDLLALGTDFGFITCYTLQT